MFFFFFFTDTATTEIYTLSLPDALPLYLDHDPWELRKNHATEVALCGGLKPGLSELEQQLSDHLTPAQLESISERRGRREAIHSEARASLQAQASAELPQRPLTSLALMSSIARALPLDIAVVEEAVTTTKDRKSTRLNSSHW